MNRAQMIRFAAAVTLLIISFSALNFFDDWTFQGMPIKFVGTAFLSGAAYLAAVSNFRIDLSPARQAMVFWAVAIVLRLVALPLAPADDLIRNQWEGKIQCAGFNPFSVAPTDARLDPLRREFPEAAKINQPELRAIDPPGIQLLFRFLVRITDRALAYKIIFAMADLAIVAVLLRLIGGEDRYRDSAWYAWNPLVAYSFAGAAHFDSVTILAMMAAILALVRSTATGDVAQQWLWSIFAAILLGVAVAFNLFAASLFLVFLFALRSRAIALAITAVIPIALSMPFGLSTVWNSLGQITQLSRLNDLFWWLAETIWDNPHQRVFHYYPIVIVCVIVVAFFFVCDWKRGSLWTLGTALVLSPVLHAWYCVWILPIATWRRAYAWHVLSITLLAYYLFWDERLFGLPWHAEPWMRALIIAPVFAALIMLAAQKKLLAEAN